VGELLWVQLVTGSVWNGISSRTSLAHISSIDERWTRNSLAKRFTVHHASPQVSENCENLAIKKMVMAHRTIKSTLV
jgi:hypothetical protein